jgi:hypothetical protein
MQDFFYALSLLAQTTRHPFDHVETSVKHSSLLVNATMIRFPGCDEKGSQTQNTNQLQQQQQQTTTK